MRTNAHKTYKDIDVMRKTLILGTALCLITGAAYAGGGGHEQPHSQPTPGSSSTALAGAAAAAASRSSATSNATAHGGSATGGNASATGGRGGRGGNASNGGQSQSTTYSGGSYSARGNTPDVFAPNISTANECALPKSAGASFLGIGLSGGFANESDSCKRQRLATMLVKMGDPKGAREALCLEEDMRRAAFSSGSPCARDFRGWDRR